MTGKARGVLCCLLAGGLVVASGPAIAPATAWAQQPAPAPPVVIDGPTADVDGLSGMAVARDGTGGLVYLKNVAGVPHVFVSRLVGGSFQPAAQADAGLAGASSQPVIAAGQGGLLLVAFINGGQLYVVTQLSAVVAAGAPQVLAAGASNPAISISNFGKAYLAFTVAGAGGGDVRAAYYSAGRWAVEASPLDANPADDAGSGSGRPAVAASGDGVGIVVWGEAGHVFSRRVWATSPSTVYEQVDVPSLSGLSEVSADLPSLGTGGDSSYATVAFRELLANGSQTHSRVLMRRLHGSQYDAVTQPDGLAGSGSDGAAQPEVAIGEYGAGLVTSARQSSNAVFAMTIGTGETAGAVAQVDSLQNATAPDAVPAMAGLYSDLIAWQHDPGTLGVPEIRVRYAPDGETLGPEIVVSSPSFGPTEADLGLAAAGDVSGDAVVAWVQGSAAAPEIVTAQLYQPPGSIAAVTRFTYARTNQPVFAWGPARDLWGPVTYTVTLDGAQLPPTATTALVAPEPLADGLHVWQVTAANRAGLISTARPGRVWVDTVAPVGRLTLTGRKQVGSYLHMYVSYTDSPPPEPRASASGIAQVVVNWGDGNTYVIKHGKFHAYMRPGRYRLTVTLTDRAGNTTKLVQMVRIVRKPTRPPHTKHHHKPNTGRKARS